MAVKVLKKFSTRIGVMKNAQNEEELKKH